MRKILVLCVLLSVNACSFSAGYDLAASEEGIQELRALLVSETSETGKQINVASGRWEPETPSNPPLPRTYKRSRGWFGESATMKNPEPWISQVWGKIKAVGGAK